jgi:transposase InsO family protein
VLQGRAAPDRRGRQRATQGIPADRASSGFKGVLQVDGYAGYRALADKGDVSLAFCWAHLPRRFCERPIAEASPIANEALQRIAALYRMETDSRRTSAPITTRQATDHHPAGDLVRRNFTAERPNALGVADITFLPTLAGFSTLRSFSTPGRVGSSDGPSRPI